MVMWPNPNHSKTTISLQHKSTWPIGPPMELGCSASTLLQNGLPPIVVFCNFSAFTNLIILFRIHIHLSLLWCKMISRLISKQQNVKRFYFCQKMTMQHMLELCRSGKFQSLCNFNVRSFYCWVVILAILIFRMNGFPL